MQNIQVKSKDFKIRTPFSGVGDPLLAAEVQVKEKIHAYLLQNLPLFLLQIISSIQY